MKFDSLFAVLSFFLSIPLFFCAVTFLYVVSLLVGGFLNILILVLLAAFAFNLGMVVYSLSVAFEFKLPISLIFLSLNTFFSIQGAIFLNNLASVALSFIPVTENEPGIGGGVGAINQMFSNDINIFLFIGIFVLFAHFIYFYESIVSKNKKGLVTVTIFMFVILSVIVGVSFGTEMLTDTLSSSIFSSIT